MVICFARLLLHFVKMYRARIYTYRRSRFHTSRANAIFCDRFGKKLRCGFCASSAAYLFLPHVYQAAQKCARRYHHRSAVEACAPKRINTNNSAVFNEDFRGFVLPDGQIFLRLQPAAPLLNKARAVALGARAPHGGTFRAVEHAELYGAGICHFACASAQRIYLADNLSFGNAADGRVATHLRYLVHIHRNHAGFRAHPCRSLRCFTARVACANHDDVVVESRLHLLFSLIYRCVQ